MGTDIEMETMTSNSKIAESETAALETAGSDHPIDTDPVDSGRTGRETDELLAALANPPSSRRWPVGLAGIAIGVVGTLVASTLINAGGEDELAQVETVDTLTVEVGTMDLRSVDEYAATLALGSTESLASLSSGTLTSVASDGTVLAAGDVIARIDGEPVILMYGSTPAYRSLDDTADPGSDITQIEQNLVDLGYGQSPAVTVDDTWLWQTTVAINQLKGDRDMEQDNAVALGEVLFVDGPITVNEGAQIGSNIGSNAELLTYRSSEDAVVTTAVAAADARDFSLDLKVTVELATGEVVDGVVTEISDSAVAPAAGQGQDGATDPTVDVSISLTDVGDALLLSGPVTVQVTSELIEGAVVVPVRSLISLAGGGSAVEIVDAAGTATLVGVELGDFSDGMVEITNDAVSVGDQILVPA